MFCFLLSRMRKNQWAYRLEYNIILNSQFVFISVARTDSHMFDISFNPSFLFQPFHQIAARERFICCGVTVCGRYSQPVRPTDHLTMFVYALGQLNLDQSMNSRSLSRFPRYQKPFSASLSL
uniref:Uncharacterized protein n=1 Tax=Daphnia magna TaxID=35525 RepID=A0A0P4YYN9_9CRUS